MRHQGSKITDYRSTWGLGNREIEERSKNVTCNKTGKEKPTETSGLPIHNRNFGGSLLFFFSWLWTTRASPSSCTVFTISMHCLATTATVNYFVKNLSVSWHSVHSRYNQAPCINFFHVWTSLSCFQVDVIQIINTSQLNTEHRHDFVWSDDSTMLSVQLILFFAPKGAEFIIQCCLNKTVLTFDPSFYHEPDE